VGRSTRWASLGSDCVLSTVVFMLATVPRAEKFDAKRPSSPETGRFDRSPTAKRLLY